jgi:signal transduction histidine kinase
LKDFVEDVIEEMDGMLKKKEQGINFVYEGVSNVYMDKKILRNIILNLLSNAIKYSPDNKTIHITVSTDVEKIVIAVRDEGIGIPLESQKHLFGKFYRANNVVNIQGTGLGLNIVKSYVELLNGTIRFTSTPAEGTEFVAELPHPKSEL